MDDSGDLGAVIQIGESSADKRLLLGILERLPLLVMAFDESLGVALWNREAARVTGRSADEIIGNPRYLELLYPDEDYREEIVAASAADFDGMERRELTLITREGVARDIAWTSMSRELQIPGFSDWWVGVDVTDVRRTERELRRSQDTLRKAHQVAQLGAWSYDVDTRRIELTPEAALLLGVGDEPSAELARFEAIIHPDDWDRVLAAAEAASRGQHSPHFELRINRPDGEQRWLRSEADFVEESARGRSTARIVGIIHDITEQRRLEHRLRQNERMEALSRLASGVAHDLNNVLTVVGGCAELLGEQIEPSEEARRELATIGESFERGRALVQELLAFSRQQVLRPSVFELGELVSRMTPLLSRAAGPEVTITTLLGDGVGSVRCDRAQLEQVILSLVVSAQGETPAGGRVTVTTRSESLAEEVPAVGGVLTAGSYAVVEVAGGGDGVDEDTAARRFEPFFEPGSAPAARMSLASAFGVVAQSGGRIRVASRAGAGTAVMVYLPVHEGAEASEPAPAPPRSQRRGERILLVEDDELVRTVVERTLRTAGYQLTVASNGEEALRLCSGGALPDLALADVVMPLMSGPELATRLRKQHPGVRVMLMSGYDSAHVQEEATTAFLPKPFAPSALLDAVRTILDR